MKRPRAPQERYAVHAPTGIEVAMSHEEIAVRLGVTASRVGQLERRALSKMRTEAERRGLNFKELFGL